MFFFVFFFFFFFFVNADGKFFFDNLWGTFKRRPYYAQCISGRKVKRTHIEYEKKK